MAKTRRRAAASLEARHRQAAQLLAFGLRQSEVAARVGVNWRTLSVWVQRSPVFREELRAAEAKALAIVREEVVQRMRGLEDAIRWRTGRGRPRVALHGGQAGQPHGVGDDEIGTRERAAATD